MLHVKRFSFIDEQGYLHDKPVESHEVKLINRTPIPTSWWRQLFHNSFNLILLYKFV